jgi:predicted ester cyclase
VVEPIINEGGRCVTAYDNRHVYKNIIVAISEGNEKGLERWLDEDIVDHNPVPGATPGREGFKQWLSTARASFPDLVGVVEDTVAEGDYVAGRVTYRATHSGPLLGIPATERTVEFQAFHLVRFSKGQAVEWWGTADILGALRQIGAEVVPPD